MNRLVLRYGYPITAVILVVFAWVVYRRLAGGVNAIPPARCGGDCRMGARLVRFHLLLAAYNRRRVQTRDPKKRFGCRSDPAEYAIRSSRPVLEIGRDEQPDGDGDR